MYRWCFKNTALLAVICFYSSIVADAIKCTDEELMYGRGNSDRFCVYRGVVWRPGTPEPVFEESSAVRVAFMESNLTSIPDGFYALFPLLDILVANNVSLEQLKIKNSMRMVFAENNRIRQVLIDGDQSLKELHLKDNPISSLGAIANSRSLEVLDVSGSNIAEDNDNTVDFDSFARIGSLKTLHLSDLGAMYFENKNNAKLPNLQALDLSGNAIIPSNFEFSVFRSMPKLEELSLLNTLMSDIDIGGDIRNNLPALQRINIAGIKLTCSVMQKLLTHLKEKKVAAVGASDANPERCELGFNRMEGFCCQPDGGFIPVIPEKPTTPSTTTIAATTSTTTATIPNDKEVSPKSKTDSETGDKGSSLVVIIVSVVAVIVVLAVAAFIGLYLKRRNEGTHKAVPRNDPNETL